MQNYLIFCRINLLFISSVLSLCMCNANAQDIYRVLFLGNSYTYFNDLPQVLHDVALSTGDTLIFDSYAPGGYQLIDHTVDIISQSKILAGGWDYVVIQGQSQEPITYNSEFFSGGRALFNQVKQSNPCAVVMPYMTWGRKNGDASICPFFPISCTYEGMDTTIRNHYLNLTNQIDGEVSPVSVVWNNLRQNHPSIELYQPDESHPSPSGSYAAACSFYASIFKKDPTLVTYDFGLSTSDAAIIRNAAKMEVFDNLQSWNFKMMPVSKFHYQIGTGINEAYFMSANQGVRQTYQWDFGDGSVDSTISALHFYLSDGTYTVSLTTTTCDLQGLHTSFSDTIIQFCSQTPTIYTANPWLCIYDTLWTQPADSYQWYSNGVALPETNQFLADYANYNIAGFSVMSTLNGCSELSVIYSENAEWPGYYFDAIGNPCEGDTVNFAVLHTSGFISGQEDIFWFKNDTLLPLMTDEDTLVITTGGKYECKVINPNAVCPLDTTSSVINYNCNVTVMDENMQELKYSLFPNPASDIINLKFATSPLKETIYIYDAIGSLIKSFNVTGSNYQFSIVDLPQGIYYFLFQNGKPGALKFVKL